MKIELFIAFLNLYISANIFSFSCLLIPTLSHLHLCNPKIDSSPDSINVDLNLCLESSQKVSEKKSATAEDIFGSFFLGSYFFSVSSAISFCFVFCWASQHHGCWVFPLVMGLVTELGLLAHVWSWPLCTGRELMKSVVMLRYLVTAVLDAVEGHWTWVQLRLSFKPPRKHCIFCFLLFIPVHW